MLHSSFIERLLLSLILHLDKSCMLIVLLCTTFSAHANVAYTSNEGLLSSSFSSSSICSASNTNSRSLQNGLGRSMRLNALVMERVGFNMKLNTVEVDATGLNIIKLNTVGMKAIGFNKVKLNTIKIKIAEFITLYNKDQHNLQFPGQFNSSSDKSITSTIPQLSLLVLLGTITDFLSTSEWASSSSIIDLSINSDWTSLGYTTNYPIIEGSFILTKHGNQNSILSLMNSTFILNQMKFKPYQCDIISGIVQSPIQNRQTLHHGCETPRSWI